MLPPRTVLAGDARVLLFVLPVCTQNQKYYRGLFKNKMGCNVRTGAVIILTINKLHPGRLPPLLPPPLVPVCFMLALRPPGALCEPLLWPRDVELVLEMVLSSCSMEHRSAIRASRSTVSPWFSASANGSIRGDETAVWGVVGFRCAIIFSGLLLMLFPLTVYVIHREAVGEVGYVCLLPQRRLLQCFLWPAIIQTLHTWKQRV